MRFLDKVKNTIETYGMDLKPGEPVLVALSGGADSTSLLLAMHELGYNVHAFHVNHNLMGSESMRAEGFCYEICSRLGIDIEIASIDVKEYSLKNKISTETASRDLRYKAFSKNVKGIKKVILAHNLNDCLETTIYKLTRGTSLKGLCGVAPIMYRRDLDITVFRPLIECTREEIEDYLNEKNTGFMTNSTNNSSDYARNVIRNKVIPILSEINPSIVKTYGDTVKALRDDSKYINGIADRVTNMLYNQKEIDLGWLVNTESALMSRILITWLNEQYNIKVSRNILNNVIRAVKTKSSVQISKTLFCRVDGDKLTIEDRAGEPENKDFDLYNENCEIIGLNEFAECSTTIEFEHSTISIKKIDSPKDAINVRNVIAVNEDIDLVVNVRHRHPGDKIKLFKRPTKTIKELFNAAEIPHYQRDRIIMLENNNELIFVDKFGVCDKFHCRQAVDGEKLNYFEVIVNYKYDFE